MGYLPLPELETNDPAQGPLKWFSAILYGGRCIGYEDFTVDDAPYATLTIPAGAKYAMIYVQGDSTSANLNRVVHFREDGGDPTTGTSGDGMPLADNGVYECRGPANLSSFKIIGIEAGKVHTIRVIYYGQA